MPYKCPIKRREAQRKSHKKHVTNNLYRYFYHRLLKYVRTENEINIAKDSYVKHIMRTAGWEIFPSEMIEAYRRRLLIKRKLKQLI